MRSRSWMAAWACIASMTGAEAPARAADTPVVNRVNLQLQITGLRDDGCTIEIKPGHPACQFDKVIKRISPGQGGETLTLEPISLDAKSSGADRDCSFAITIKEPGQPPKTFRRGVRLSTRSAGEPAPVQNLKVYLNAPSVASKGDSSKARR